MSAREHIAFLERMREEARSNRDLNEKKSLPYSAVICGRQYDALTYALEVIYSASKEGES